MEAVPQHMRALTRANEIRIYRAGLRKQVKERPALAGELIADPTPEVESMPLFELLMFIPRFGRTRVLRLLQVEAISETRTVGALTDRQRGKVIGRLR